MLNKDEIEIKIKECFSYADLSNKIFGYVNGKTLRILRNFVNKNKIDNMHFDAKIKRRIYKLVDRECPVCGKIFKTKIGHSREKKTCSHSCSNTLFRTGENNGNFVNGNSSYKDICFRNYEHKCLICDERKILDVHHVDRDTTNNSKENLIPLCPTHHRYIHSKYKEEIFKKLKKIIY